MQESVLITGANGEIGHGLIQYLRENSDDRIISLDINPLDKSLIPLCDDFIQADILDFESLRSMFRTHHFDKVYHLASLLSTSAEHNPELAHRVNVEGTLELLRLSNDLSRERDRPVCFLYPSSIAVYGIPDLQTKNSSGKVPEQDWCCPTTMYGCNKLYCEQLGTYYAEHYRQLTAAPDEVKLDFRGLRYPGLISAFTIPSGGTSDYGPEMLHHAAQDQSYDCFVRPDARLPFMVMPDAIKAIIELASAPAANLSRRVYNVTSFSPDAAEFYALVQQAFPDAVVKFKPDTKRQGIVDSWPGDIDDSAARKDWGWQPDYDLQHAFFEYLVPNIRKRYNVTA